MSSDNYILGIDTSNYKTSLALLNNDKIEYDIRKFLEVKQGERGLRQSDALFQHIRNLPELFESLGKEFDGKLAAIAYSEKPRPVEGSYMPCFLAGSSFARSLGQLLHIPVFSFSHQEGHIEAVKAYSPYKDAQQFIACHFSGGTCECLLVNDVNQEDKMYDISIEGGSKDISFGQVLDRAGVALGMKFPAGQELDSIAINAKAPSSLLTPVKVKEGYINLSGIDTQISRLIESNQYDRDMLICEMFTKLSDAAIKMIMQVADKTGIRICLMSGGVSSSLFMRERIRKKLSSKGIDIYFDTSDLSSDNAVGTALLGARRLWD